MVAFGSHVGVLAAAFLASPACPIDPLPPGAVQRLGSPRFRHGTEIVSSILSPDGKLLATAGTRSVIVWDVATGKRLHIFPSNELNGTQTTPAVLAISPTSQYLAVSRPMGPVSVWNLTTGKREWEYSLKHGFPRCFRFGDTDDILHVISLVMTKPNRSEDQIQTWLVPQGALLSSVARSQGWTGQTFAPGRFDLRFEPATNRGWVVEWQTGRETAFAPPKWSCMAVSPDGKRVVGIAPGGKLGVMDVRAGGSVIALPLPERLKRRDQQGKKYWAALPQFSEDAREVWVRTHGTWFADSDPSLYRWDAKTGDQLPTLPGHPGGVISAYYPPDGKTIITVGHGGMIRRWDRATGREVAPPVLPGGQAAFSADGSTFGIVGDGRIVIVETRTGDHRTVSCPKDTAYSLALAPDGHVAAVSHFGNTISLIGTVTGHPRRTFHAAGDAWFSELNFSPRGDLLAATGRGSVVWDVPTGRVLWHKSRQLQPRFTQDTAVLSSSLDRQVFRMWDPITGEDRYQTTFAPLGTANDHPAWWITMFAVSPSKKLLAGACMGGHVALYDLTTGQPIHGLPVFPLKTGMSAMVQNLTQPSALAFSADSRWLAVGTTTHAVELWEVASGTRVAHFDGHDAPVRVVQFAPDGRTLWSAGGGGLAYRWDLFPRSSRPLGWGEVWARLTKGAPAEVPAAVRAVIDDPAAAARFLRTMYTPLSREEVNRIAGLIANLGDEDFATREKAEEALFWLGLRTVVQLRRAARDPNPERATRADRVLTRLGPEERAAAARAGRVVAALELAGTPEVRSLLEEWVKKDLDPHLTAEAKAALGRLRAGRDSR